MDEGERQEKKASLIVFGIVELLGGALCILLALFTLLPLMISSSGVSKVQILPGSMVYVFLAVWLIWMAIGTMRARRWARSLMLAASWLGLACGAMAMGMMLFMLPKLFANGRMSPELVVPMLVAILLILALVYLMIPAIGIVFYSNRKVRTAFELADSKPSWPERCPLPVLVLSMMLVMAILSMAMLCFMNFSIPFFGIILSGGPGALALLLVMGIAGWMAVGVYRLRAAAWWCALFLLAIGLASQLITFGRIDLMEYYAALGYSDQMLQQVESMDWMNNATFEIMALVYALPAFIYLLWLKRYFEPNKA